MNNLHYSTGAFSMWKWWTSRSRRFWMKVISLLLIECFLFYDAMKVVAQQESPPQPEYPQEEISPPEATQQEEQPAEQPYQPQGTDILPGIGWETPLFQSTDAEVDNDAEDIRNEILSADQPPVPSSDIDDYVAVLDLPGITTNLTKISYTYTTEADPENEGILTQVTMNFDNKPDDVETYTPSLTDPSPLYGSNGKPTQVEYHYERDENGNLKYFQVDGSENYLQDNDGHYIEVANENEGKAMVTGIRLWFDSNTGEYVKFDYSSGTRQQSVYRETRDAQGVIYRWDPTHDLVIHEETATGLETDYVYHWDVSGERIEWYEETTLGVTYRFESGEDQNFDGVLGEDLNGNNVLDLDFSEDLNGNGALDLLINEDADNDGFLDVGEDLNGNGQLDTELSEDLNNNNILDKHLNEDFNGNGSLDAEDVNGNGSLDPWILKWVRSVSDEGTTVTYYENGLISRKELPDGTVWWYDYETNQQGTVVVSRLENRNASVEMIDDGGTFKLVVGDENVTVAIVDPGQVSVDGHVISVPANETETSYDLELISGETVTFIFDIHGQLKAQLDGTSPFVIANTKAVIMVDEVSQNGSTIYQKIHHLMQDNVAVKYENGAYSLNLNGSTVTLEIQADGSLKVGNSFVSLGSSLWLSGFGNIMGGADYGLSSSIDGGLTIAVANSGLITIAMLGSEPVTIGYTKAAQVPLSTYYYGNEVLRQDDEGNIIQSIDYTGNNVAVTSYKYEWYNDGSLKRRIIDTNGIVQTYDEDNNLLSVQAGGILTEYLTNGLEHKITYLDTGKTLTYSYEPDVSNVDLVRTKTEVEYDPEYPDANKITIYDFQKNLITSITDRNGNIRMFTYYALGYTEDLNGNGSLDPTYTEDLNGNSQLDIDWDEDTNGNSLLDAGEDINGNGLLDNHVNEDLNGDAFLTADITEDRDNDGQIDTTVISSPTRHVLDYKDWEIAYYIETRSNLAGTNTSVDFVFGALSIKRTLQTPSLTFDASLTDDQMVARGLLSQINQNGQIRNFTYGNMDINGNSKPISTETHPDTPGFELIRAYDESYRTIWQKQGDSITEFTYIGSITEETGKYESGGVIAGKITREYDDNSDIISLTDRNGNVSTFTYDYDGFGNRVNSYETRFSFNGQNLGITTRQFDVEDNLISITDKNGYIKEYTLAYNEQGMNTGSVETDPRYTDLQIVREFDNDGRVISERTLGSGGVERKYVEYQYEIDPFGELRAQIQIELGATYVRTTTRKYNSKGDVTAIYDFNNQVTHYSYAKDIYENITGTVQSHPYNESDFFNTVPQFNFENETYGYVEAVIDNGILTNYIYNLTDSGEKGNRLIRVVQYADTTTAKPMSAIDYINGEIWAYTYNGSNQLEHARVYDLQRSGTAGALKRTITYNTSNGHITAIESGDDYVTNIVYSGDVIQSAEVRHQSASGDLVRTVEFNASGQVYRVAVYNASGTAERWLQYSYRTVNNLGNYQAGGTYSVIDSITEYNNPDYADEHRTRQITHPSQSGENLPFTSMMQFSIYRIFENNVARQLKSERTFNKENDLISYIDEDGVITSFEYEKDAIGNNSVIRETSSKYSGTVEREYNTEGQVVSSTARNGFVTNYANVLDDEGRLSSIQETMPDFPDALTVRSYDGEGRVTSINQNGIEFAYSYELDSLGNIVRSFETNADFPASVTTRAFNVLNNALSSVTDQNGNVTDYLYNQAEKLDKTELYLKDNLSSPKRYTLYYTSGLEEGRVTEIQDNDGAVVRSFTYEFDSFGSMRKSVELDGPTDGLFPGYRLEREFNVNTGSLVALSDHSGRVLSYNYDNANRLASTADNRGNVTTFYTVGQALGQIDSLSDAAGPVSTFTYEFDTLGNISRSFESAAGFSAAITTRAFSSNGNLNTVTARDGSVSSFHYINNDVLESTEDDSNNVTYYYTDGESTGQAEKTVSNGEDQSYFSYEFDTASVLQRSFETNAQFPAAITTRAFNTVGNLDTITTPRGRVSSFYYDNTVLSSILDDRGNRTDFYLTGQPKGQVSELHDNDGLQTQFSYEFDSRGTMLRSFESDSDYSAAITTRQFNTANGNLATSTDKNGLATSYYYNVQDVLESVLDANNNLSILYTDGSAEGQVKERSDSSGLVSSFTYEFDSLGTMQASYETNGVFPSAISTRAFNVTNDTIESLTDKNGVVTSFYYVDEDVLSSIVDTEGSVTTFYTAGDAEGQAAQTSRFDRLTSAFSYEFDTATGNILASFETNGQHPDWFTTRRFEQVSGNVQTSTSPSGQVTSFHYDGQILNSVVDDRDRVTNFYTSGLAKGQVSQTSAPAGLISAYSYEFDSLGNIQRSFETQYGIDGRFTTRAFNVTNGTVETSTDRFGSVSSFDYDSQERLVSVWDSKNSVTRFYTGGVWEGQVSQTSRNDALTAVYSYELVGGTVSRSFETARGIDGRFTTRAFNTETGNIATSTNQYGRVSSFAYDAFDRVVSVWDSRSNVTAFYIDGAWEGQVSTTSKDDALTAAYSYELVDGDVVRSFETSRGIDGRFTTRAFNTETGNIATSTDRFGAITSFYYDTLDRLVSVADEQNRITKFYTDGASEGQVWQTSKNDGLLASYTYELESGEVVRSFETARGIDGRFTTRAFNTETGNIATSTDRFGGVTSFDYDSVAALISVWDSQSNVTKFYIDGVWEGQVSETSKTNELTAVFAYEMESGDVVRSFETTRGVAGRYTTRAFNTATGNIATSTDRFGKVSSFDYDTIDRLVSVWDEGNAVTKFYTDGDWEGQVSETSKNDNVTAVFSYEITNGDVVRSFETSRGIDGRFTTRAFDTDTGNIATSTDRFGGVTSFDYDSADRLVSVWDTQNNVTKFYTDGTWEGQVSQTSKNDYLSAAFSYEVDSGDVVRSFETTRGEAGKYTTRAFNTATGNIATSTDVKGRVSSFDYDSIDRLMSVWDTKKNVTKFYTDGDWEGQVSATSDETGLTAVFSYELVSGDVVRSFETEKGIIGRYTTRAFNTDTGNVATSTDRYGKVSSFDYDSLDRLTSVWDKNNNITKFYVDGEWESQVKETSKNSDLMAVFSYEIQNETMLYSYETQYGVAGRFTTRAFNTETENIASSTDRFGNVSSYDYDTIDRLVSVWDTNNAVTKFYTGGEWDGQVMASSKNDILTAAFSYEMVSGDIVRSFETARGIDGRFTTRAFNTDTGNIATSTDRFGKVSSYYYDSVDRLLSVIDSRNNVTSFYTDGIWEGQVSGTSKNGNLLSAFSYEMVSGDIVRSFETERGIDGRFTTRAFNTETGNIETSTDRFGSVSSFAYDSFDRITSIWDSRNGVTHFYTDGVWEGQVSEISKNNILTAVYSYELESGDVSRSFETARGIDGRFTTRAFNTESGNIATSTDQFGKVSSFDYDSSDRLISIWDAQNNVTKFYTDGIWEGQVSATSKTDTLTSAFSYEMESGTVVRSFETARGVDGRFTTRAFNTDTGNIATSTDRFNNVSSFDYDNIDRLISIWDEQNAITHFYTDGTWEGQVSDTSKNGALISVFSYELVSGDVSRSFETARGIDGRFTTRAFNTESGNINTSTDQFGKVSSFAYNSADSLVSIWDAQNNVTKFYTDGDWEGQVSATSKTDTLTAAFSYEMVSGDVVRSFETTRGVTGRYTTRAFNTATGNIATSTDRFNNVSSFDYDSIDRLISIWDEQNSITRFYTDGIWEGQVSDISKNDILMSVFSYELESGDVVRSFETARGIDGRFTTRAFNTESGNIDTSTDQFGKVSSFAYNSADSLVSIWDAQNNVTKFYTDGDWEGQVSATSKTD
ncbi:MAG: RHS repeat protein, partial [Candidatus Auribacter fodinae]